MQAARHALTGPVEHNSSFSDNDILSYLLILNSVLQNQILMSCLISQTFWNGVVSIYGPVSKVLGITFTSLGRNVLVSRTGWNFKVQKQQDFY